MPQRVFLLCVASFSLLFLRVEDSKSADSAAGYPSRPIEYAVHSSPGVGVVTWNGEIHLDSKKMKFYGAEIAMAVIAHELAHFHMGHYKDREGSQEKQIEADELAKNWGFDMEKFRKEFPIDDKET